MNLVITIIAALFLYTSNPTDQDFNIFVRDTVQSNMGEQDNALVKLFVGGMLTEAVKQGTYRKDYLFFSKYTVDTTLVTVFRKDFPAKVEFIGVAGHFFPLTKF